MHALQVASDGLRAKRHRSVHPRADPGGTPAFDVAAEVVRNLNGGVNVSAFQTVLEFGIGGQRRLLNEIARASQLLQIGEALGTLIVIEDGEGKVVDVRRDAESKY